VVPAQPTAAPDRAKYGTEPGRVRKAAATTSVRAPSAQAAGVGSVTAARRLAQTGGTTGPQPIASYPQTPAGGVASLPQTPAGGVAAPAPSRAARRRAAAHRRALARRRAARRRRAAARRRAVAQRAAVPPVVAAASVAATRKTATKASAQHRTERAARPAPPHSGHPSSGGGVSIVTRTVRDIVAVIPRWAKALIITLAALLAVAAALVVGAALRNRRLRLQRAALAEQVGVLQAALLPEVPGHLGALGLSVAYRPAEGLAAGGDFYDAFALEGGRVGIVVGDVSGHGRESLGPAASIRQTVRAYLEAGLSARAAVQLAGNVLDDKRRDEFATVVVAIHDSSAGTLSYAAAGHPPPVMTGPGAHRPLTVASSPPLGIGSPTGLRQTILPLGPGSTVCFFTDGLIECRTHAGAGFGVEGVERVLRELGPRADARALVERVEGECEPLRDDVAVCLARVDTDVVANKLRVEEIEVTSADLDAPRLPRFLEACGLDKADLGGVIRSATPDVLRYGSVVLRVRLADGRSGVDVLPVESETPSGELTLFRPLSHHSA
jgi:serine phosphatase RsbU (regulator of sigma subunit)